MNTSIATIDFDHTEQGTIFTNIQRHYILLSMSLGPDNSKWLEHSKFEAVNELAWHTIYKNPKLYNIGRQEILDKIEELIEN